MTEAELELAILRKYVEHFDNVGLEAHKCARELDMREVISEAIGRPADEAMVKRWHTRLAPPPPYPAGLLRPCSITPISNNLHRFHARAYYEPGKAPAWERIAELEKALPVSPSLDKEKEQKFGILHSLKQAQIDFTSYRSGLNADSVVGFLFLDIDNFKSLNTNYTEAVVDREILVPFQHLLSSACVHRGGAYRHGGEEFLVLLPNHTADEVRGFAERLRRRVKTKKFTVGENSVFITVSIGISLFPKHGDEFQLLVERANTAEHSAKEKGKDRTESFE